MTINKLFANFDNYLPLNQQEREALADRVTERTIRRRQFILQEGDICKPQVYTTAVSSRHDAGANLSFSDGHASFFKYSYICFNDTSQSKAGDPGTPDINWSCDGIAVP